MDITVRPVFKATSLQNDEWTFMHIIKITNSKKIFFVSFADVLKLFDSNACSFL